MSHAYLHISIHVNIGMHTSQVKYRSTCFDTPTKVNMHKTCLLLIIKEAWQSLGTRIIPV